jgi:tetratricopeptide (TPR) repeat protein
MSLRLNEDAAAPDDDRKRLKRALLEGSQAERKHALTRLIELGDETTLTEVLCSENLFAAQLATAGLWECWLNESGPAAREAIDKGIACMNGGDLTDALAIFQKLAELHPEWAEALNKQATVYYLLGNARHSLRLCKTVVKLKPHHFGAWNGMALCAAQLEKWQIALDAARKALSLQPTALANHDLIQLAETKLREEG